jgi:uncharacterized protein (TIGR01777 family)
MVLLVLVEVGLTLWDFVVEDESRKLPASERITHTLLAINGGALFALYGAQLVHWVALPTALVPLELGWRGWALSLFGLGVALSGVRDALAARQQARQPVMPNIFADRPMQRVLITGGTGFIGKALVVQLLDAGHVVTVLTREPLRAAYDFGGRVRSLASVEQLHAGEAFDVVINLAGAPVIGPRWSPARKQYLLRSRVATTEALTQWLARAQHKPAVWVQASAIGFYGVRDSAELLYENSSVGQGFMAELCQRWEAATAPVTAAGVRLITLRLGVVFGPGGALPPLLLPYRFGFGGRLGNGRQVLSWIHRDDVLALMAAAIFDTRYEGVYNVVAPQAVTQAEFAEGAGRVLRRPVWLHLPAAPIRLLAGEMAELFVDGQRVLPARLQEAGFQFRFAELQGALRSLK